MSDFFGYSAPAGVTDADVTNERWALWAGATWYLLKGVRIDSGASDAGNSPTNELRHGLLMGIVSSNSSKATNYAPNATNGSEIVSGFLWEPRNMKDTSGNAVDRDGQLCVMGPVKNGQLLLLDSQARAQMYGRFLFDDDLSGNSMGWKRTVAKTASYSVLVSDNNTIFTNTGAAGAVTFTLPAAAKGLRYRFFGTANQNLLVTGAAANLLVAANNATATTVALQTANLKIGSGFEVVADDTGLLWLVMPIGAGTVTVS